jgi:opacity protein-like surface antigen
MKIPTSLLITTAAMLGVLFSTSVQAQSASQAESQYYLGAQIGAHDLDNWTGIANIGANINLNARLELDGNREGGVFIGRQTEHARFELEYQRGSFDIGSVDLGPILDQRIDASGNYQGLTLNAYRTAALTDNLGAYLGIGIGWGEANLPRADFTNGCSCLNDATGNGFIYLARLGLDYHLGKRLDLGLQYTWLADMPALATAVNVPGVQYARQDIGIAAVTFRFHW